VRQEASKKREQRSDHYNRDKQPGGCGFLEGSFKINQAQNSHSFHPEIQEPPASFASANHLPLPDADKGVYDDRTRG